MFYIFFYFQGSAASILCLNVLLLIRIENIFDDLLMFHWKFATVLGLPRTLADDGDVGRGPA